MSIKKFATVATLLLIVPVALIVNWAVYDKKILIVKQPAINAPAPTTTSSANSLQAQAPPTTPQVKSTTTSNKTSQPYVPSVCTKTPILHKTVYVDAPWLNVGVTQVANTGQDGFTQSCTVSSTGYKSDEYSSPAFDTRILVGSNKPSTTTTTGLTYAQAQSNCRAIVQGASSAYEQCLHAYGY